MGRIRRGANEIGCPRPSVNPAMMNAMMSTSLDDRRRCLKNTAVPDSRQLDDRDQPDYPSPSANGGAPGAIDLKYSPNAIAASATGAAKPTVADSQPARNPKAGW